MTHLPDKFNTVKLNSMILSDRYNSIIFGKRKNLDVYIVGGYIRDILLGRESPDRDYAIKGDFRRYLREVASELDGKIIRIGKRGLYRIVLKNGMMLDFMPLYKNIADDLSERDFTINSLAWSPGRGVIDPHGGMQDLADSLIKMVKEENLRDDPVRILRAYRFSGELSFAIEDETRRSLKLLGNLLKEAKSERITLEFYKILNSKTTAGTLGLLLSDGILTTIISCFYAELETKIKAINKINKIFNKLPLNHRIKLDSDFSQGLTYKGLIRLEVLLRGIPDNLLRISSDISKRLVRLEKAYEIRGNRRKQFTKEDLYDIFSIAGDASAEFLIMENRIKYLDEFDRYRSLKKKGLLSTKEIIKYADVSEGKTLGYLIELLKKEEFAGKTTTKTDAIKLLDKILNRG